MVIPDIAGHDDHISRSAVTRLYIHPVRDKSNSGRVDIYASCALDHLRVACDNDHASLFCGLCHRCDDLFQLGDVCALLQYESAGDILRCRAPHEQVVHRPADAQTPDVSSRKFKWRYHKTVCGHRDRRVSRNDCCVLHLREHFIGKCLLKYLRNQFSCRAATTAVLHNYLVQNTPPSYIVICKTARRLPVAFAALHPCHLRLPLTVLISLKTASLVRYHACALRVLRIADLPEQRAVHRTYISF